MSTFQSFSNNADPLAFPKSTKETSRANRRGATEVNTKQPSLARRPGKQPVFMTLLWKERAFPHSQMHFKPIKLHAWIFLDFHGPLPPLSLKGSLPLWLPSLAKDSYVPELEGRPSVIQPLEAQAEGHPASLWSGWKQGPGLPSRPVPSQHSPSLGWAQLPAPEGVASLLC